MYCLPGLVRSRRVLICTANLTGTSTSNPIAARGTADAVRRAAGEESWLL